MATTKMKAPKSETCWGSNFDFRNLNILLLSLSISLSRNPLTLALLSFNSCLWLLYSRTLHLGLLSSLLKSVFCQVSSFFRSPSSLFPTLLCLDSAELTEFYLFFSTQELQQAALKNTHVNIIGVIMI